MPSILGHNNQVNINQKQGFRHRIKTKTTMLKASDVCHALTRLNVYSQASGSVKVHCGTAVNVNVCTKSLSIHPIAATFQ